MVDVIKYNRPVCQPYRNYSNSKGSGFVVDLFDGKSHALSAPQLRRINTSKTLIKAPIMNLPVGKLHVLKMMNSESEPTIPRVRKLSKYMPLPSIKGIKTPPKPARPKLLREKTYKVLEPVYVRGPSDMIEMAPAERVSRKKAELPHIRERQRPSQVSQKPSERPKSSRMSKTNELSIPRRNKAFNQVNNKNDDLRTINQQIINRGFKFNPSVVRNNGPARTVFWFPV